MYKSPIEIIYGQAQTQIEGDIFRAVQSYTINVVKNELIRALQYDRQQYDKGYADGKADAQKWIPVTERLPDLELVEAKANVCDSYVCLTAKRGFTNKDQIFIIKAWYYGDRFENDDGIDITDDVTHWMPLPQPPTTCHMTSEQQTRGE